MDVNSIDMEEIEEIQEIEKPVSSEELSAYLADKFDIPPGPVKRRPTVPEMIRELTDKHNNL